MRTLQEIKFTLSNNKQRLFAKYPIQSMAIFGSYSRREQNDNSDLDILVEFKDKIGIRFIDLAEEIESIIETSLKTNKIKKVSFGDIYIFFN